MLYDVYWILATIFILAALVVPRLRPVGVIGCVLLGAMLTWGVIQRLRSPADELEPKVQQRGRPTSPAAAVQVIALDQVRVDDLKLSGSGAPFELQGRIENKSDALLRSVTLLVARHDCYDGALDPTGCAVLWQDRQWISVSIPPGQSRDFSTSVWMRGAAPRARGVVQDSFTVVAASGEIALPAATAEPAAQDNNP
ncbi:MAG: hypothetical protein SXG53_17655 [Pseudomonadota bacterium]|nr:hypothetical protein [Pseudomonadota bacterium]